LQVKEEDVVLFIHKHGRKPLKVKNP